MWITSMRIYLVCFYKTLCLQQPKTYKNKKVYILVCLSKHTLYKAQVTTKKLPKIIVKIIIIKKPKMKCLPNENRSRKQIVRDLHYRSCFSLKPLKLIHCLMSS